MKRSLLILCLVFGFGYSQAQVDIPEEFSLETPEDYGEMEGLVKESLKWLLNTPMHENLDVRNEQNAFIMIWLTGSPTISLDIDSKAMPFLENNEILMYTFIQGMAYYKLYHPEEGNKITLHAHGLNAVAKQLHLSEGYFEKDKSLKSLLRAHKKGKMMKYTEELLNTEA